MTKPIALSLLALPLLAVACVDNSGGPPPAGTELTVERQPQLVGSCSTFRDEAFLIESSDELPAFFDECEGIPEDLRTGAYTDAIGELGADDAFLFVNVQLGGCLGDHALQGAFLEGDTLHAWVLRSDAAYGRFEQACTDDLGESGLKAIVRGGAAATNVDVVIGVFNEELPGGPALPL